MPLGNEIDRVNMAGARMPGNDGMVTASATGTSYRLHQVSAARTAKVRKIVLHNRGAAQTFVYLGDTDTGVDSGAWTQRMAGFQVPVGAVTITEEEIPAVEFNATSNIFARISATATVDISTEVEES